MALCNLFTRRLLIMADDIKDGRFEGNKEL